MGGRICSSHDHEKKKKVSALNYWHKTVILVYLRIVYDQSSFFILEAAMEIFAAIICSKTMVSTYGWNAMFVYLADEACSRGFAEGLS